MNHRTHFNVEIACVLYVGVVVYGTPQEWLRSALLFGFGLCFNC